VGEQSFKSKRVCDLLTYNVFDFEHIFTCAICIYERLEVCQFFLVELLCLLKLESDETYFYIIPWASDLIINLVVFHRKQLWETESMLTTSSFEWNLTFLVGFPNTSITRLHRKMSWNLFISFFTYSIETTLLALLLWRLKTGFASCPLETKEMISHLCRVWWARLCSTVSYCLIRWLERNRRSGKVGEVEHWTALLSRLKNSWLLQFFSLTTQSSPATCQN